VPAADGTYAILLCCVAARCLRSCLDPASASLPSCRCLQCTPDRLPGNILAQLETWMVQNQTLLESEWPALPALQPRSHIRFLQQVSAVWGCHWVLLSSSG
jgi:hypothetical protein